MRHLGRTHRVSVAWLHERFKTDGVDLVYEMTHRQAADIYTKAFANGEKWYAACLLVSIIDGLKLQELFKQFTIHAIEKHNRKC